MSNLSGMIFKYLHKSFFSPPLSQNPEPISPPQEYGPDLVTDFWQIEGGGSDSVDLPD